MPNFTKIFELVMCFSVICFPLTTGIMVFSLKRLGYDPVGASVKTKWSMDIDIRFFSRLRSGYAQVRGNRVIPALNFISFYLILSGLTVGLFIVPLYEIW